MRTALPSPDERPKMLPELDDYDWREAFDCGNPPSLVAGAFCTTDCFNREDVVRILELSDGINDGNPWVIAGELKDGRWFYLEAWCDYTGWDCQAGGHSWVSHSLDNLVQFGLTSSGRDRLTSYDTWTE